MSSNHDLSNRAVVTCTTCGTPYAAMVDDDGELALLGLEQNACPNCDGVSFARLSL